MVCTDQTEKKNTQKNRSVLSSRSASVLGFSCMSTAFGPSREIQYCTSSRPGDSKKHLWLFFASAAILDSRSRGIQSLTSFDHGNSRETGVSNCCGSRMCSSKRLGERTLWHLNFFAHPGKDSELPWITPDLHDVSRRHLVCTLYPQGSLWTRKGPNRSLFFIYFGSRHPKPWCLMYLAHIEYVNKALVAIIAILLISALRYTLWQLLDRDKFAFNYTVIVGGLILRSLSFEFRPHEYMGKFGWIFSRHGIQSA